MSPGRLITLEGGEGAGKSTQARMLADALCELGIPVLRTREPGGAPGAEFLREVLLSGRIDWGAEAETMLHVAARVEHVAKTIRPAIDAGSWVVCDRFHDSTMAYQGYGQGVDRGMIEALAGMVGIAPDLTLVLEVPRDVALARLRRRGAVDDRYERLDEAFHQRVTEGFRAIAALPRCVLVDATRDAAVVHEAVMQAVRTHFPPVNRSPPSITVRVPSEISPMPAEYSASDRPPSSACDRSRSGA